MENEMQQSNVNRFFVPHLEEPNFEVMNDYQQLVSSLKLRQERIKRSQLECKIFFEKYNVVIDQLKHETALSTISKYIYAETSFSDSASTYSELEEFSTGSTSTPSITAPATNQIIKTTDVFEQPQAQLSTAYSNSVNNNDNMVVIGPNGTKVNAIQYNNITWNSGSAATRILLSLIFTSEILATHTLTGKQSLAFYGRERPEKMQLNPLIVADIIHCVREMCGCSEREVRSAITSKCAEAAKKHKRRLLKKLKR